VKVGDTAGARKTLASALTIANHLKRDAETKWVTLSSIAEAQATAGDIAGARKTFASALKAANTIREGGGKEKGLRHIAEAEARTQAAAGDIAGAQTILTSVMATTDLGEYGWDINSTQRAIAEAQTNLGDVAGAQNTLASALATADFIPSAGLKSLARSMTQRAIAEAQVKVGDLAGAQKTLTSALKTADLIDILDQQDKEKAAIVDAQEKIGNTRVSSAGPTSAAHAPTQLATSAITVALWLNKLDDEKSYDACPLNTTMFLDLPNYLKAKTSDDPSTLYYMLKDTAEKMLKAQGAVDQLLKQQAKR
jgi:hypothetical protein